ncbi:MAG TPA: acyltransferase [Fimbriimonas sp.]
MPAVLDLEKAVVEHRSSAHPARWLALDSCRGLAALAVLLFHYTVRFDEIYGHDARMRLFLSRGDLAVEFFFVLSGFVIFMTLRKVADRREFFVKRFARLMPVYWASVLTTYATVAVFGLPGREVHLGDAAINLTMFPTLVGVPMVDGVYWSLQVEVLFYVTVCLLLFPARLSFRRAAKVGAAGLMLLTFLHGLKALAPETPADKLAGTIEQIGLVYLPLFATGIMLYFYRVEGQKRALTWMGASVAVHAFATGMLEAACLFVFIGGFLFVLSPKGKWLAARPLVWLGSVSYALYAMHQNIGYVVIRGGYQAGLHPYVSILAAGAVSVGVAAVVTGVVEKRGRRWILSRFFPRDGLEAEKIAA